MRLCCATVLYDCGWIVFFCLTHPLVLLAALSRLPFQVLARHTLLPCTDFTAVRIHTLCLTCYEYCLLGPLSLAPVVYKLTEFQTHTVSFFEFCIYNNYILCCCYNYTVHYNSESTIISYQFNYIFSKHANVFFKTHFIEVRRPNP